MLCIYRALIYADPHWCTYSSILRSRGEKYSLRLENLIQTMNFIETIGTKYSVNSIFCLGDFFDSSQITAEETTALSEIQFNTNIEHISLVGNHEISRSNLDFSTSSVFAHINNYKVINSICNIFVEGVNIVLYPYTNNEEHMKYSFISPYMVGSNNILLSHMDIKGIQMGRFISSQGLDLSMLNNSFTYIFNGHLHNECYIDRLINVGNITGLNFSEDASKYRHGLYMLNIDNGNISFEFIENPYAFKFFKLNVLSDSDVVYIDQLSKLPNVIANITTNENYIDCVKYYATNFVEHRLLLSTTVHKQNVMDSNNDLQLSTDHIEQFRNYVMSEIGTNDIIMDELEFLLK